jgi:23S rRNA pseudouridine1911/1915/1917 synthase
LQILFEDDYLLAVNKPAGLTTESAPTARFESAEAWARRYVADARTGRAEPYVRAVHRIDRPASGVLLLAKSKAALSDVMRQFELRTVEKYYLAETERPLPGPTGTLRHWLRRDETGKRALITDEPVEGAQLAELTYRVRAGRVVEVELHSGRFHQIRAQLAHVGCPIVGDVAYGGTPWRENEIKLHAERLVVDHPKSGERLLLTADCAWLEDDK